MIASWLHLQHCPFDIYKLYYSSVLNPKFQIPNVTSALLWRLKKTKQTLNKAHTIKWKVQKIGYRSIKVRVEGTFSLMEMRVFRGILRTVLAEFVSHSMRNCSFTSNIRGSHSFFKELKVSTQNWVELLNK